MGNKHILGLTYNRCATAMLWGKQVFLINESNENLHVDKNLDLYLKLYIKTNFRWIIYLNVIGKITNDFHSTYKRILIWG